MAFDGLVLNAVTEELKNNLIGGKVQKVYQPSQNEVLLSIYANSLQYALCLNISANFYCAHLTTSKRENPTVAPNFCMLLRKHLTNSKLANIYTIGLERILIIEFSDDEDNNTISKKLIVELMGKHSNILLLDNSNIIIDAIRHFSISDGANRNIFPKEVYTFPTSNKIDILDYLSFENNLPTDSTLTQFFIDTFIGISKTFVEYSIQTLNLSNDLNKENYTKLANYIISLKNSISLNEVKCINFQNDYTITHTDTVEALQVNFFLDDYYSSKQLQEQFITYRNSLLNFISAKLKKLEKKLIALNSKLEECTHMEEYKIYGELITSNLYKISDEHISHIVLDNYYSEKQVDIPLDISLSPSDNAKKYFKKYHKLKNTYSIVQEQKIQLEEELNYLGSIVYEIQTANSIKDLDNVYDEIQEDFAVNKTNSNVASKKNSKKKVQKMKKVSNSESPIIYMIDNFKVLVGRNNKQNDELTFKIASKDDIWFHVKDIHGSHVILQTNGKMPSQETINKCAAITAYHSKAMQSSNVPVDYTFVKYVKKPNKAKPGMVIYTNQETVNVNPKIF